MNFSPTHLTSVECGKGRITVEVQKLSNTTIGINFGYPYVFAFFKGPPDQIPFTDGYLALHRTVSDEVKIPKEEIDKVLAPIL